MKTRCDSLDECVVVSGFPISNLSKRVTVTECVEWLGRPAWLYFGEEIIGMNGERAHCIADECLMPVRRRRATDERVDDIEQQVLSSEPLTFNE
jgi:hypothetical protein